MELKVYFAAKNFKIHPCKGIFKKVIEKAMLWEKKKVTDVKILCLWQNNLFLPFLKCPCSLKIPTEKEETLKKKKKDQVIINTCARAWAFPASMVRLCKQITY